MEAWLEIELVLLFEFHWCKYWEMQKKCIVVKLILTLPTSDQKYNVPELEPFFGKKVLATCTYKEDTASSKKM